MWIESHPFSKFIYSFGCDAYKWKWLCVIRERNDSQAHNFGSHRMLVCVCLCVCLTSWLMCIFARIDSTRFTSLYLSFAFNRISSVSVWLCNQPLFGRKREYDINQEILFFSSVGHFYRIFNRNFARSAFPLMVTTTIRTYYAKFVSSSNTSPTTSKWMPVKYVSLLISFLLLSTFCPCESTHECHLRTENIANINGNQLVPTYLLIHFHIVQCICQWFCLFDPQLLFILSWYIFPRCCYCLQTFYFIFI